MLSARLALVLVACGRTPPTLTDPTPIEAPSPVPVTPPAPPTPWSTSDRAVVLVSLDGFRWDYRDRAYTPTLDRLVAEGVTADALVPVFPTKTFPNHYTQVTGLYPHEHGIVGNSFYDSELDDSFEMGFVGTEWWGGEPIWITAARHGRRTATLFWPGSETAFDGLRPDAWLPFDGGMPHEDRVDQVLAWHAEPTPPHFTTLYFSDVDSAGHSYGPDSAEVIAAIEEVDAALARLVDGLEAIGRLDDVDLLVVSDHGMADQDRDRAVFLDDHVDPADFWIAAWGPYVTLDPRQPLQTDPLVALADLPHATCYDATTRPAELHFPAGPRIPPYVCLAEVGWSLTSRSYFDATPAHLVGATHGWAPSASEMHGIFVGRGPHLAEGATHPAFSAVDLYALMTTLLDIPAAPNSGDPAATAGLLR
jgi:predicted AlkP superfamily pyrophosphatase or phosphodiesterase